MVLDACFAFKAMRQLFMFLLFKTSNYLILINVNKRKYKVEILYTILHLIKTDPKSVFSC
jgi:hypothetical protein